MINKQNRLYASLNLWDIEADGTIRGMSGEAAALYRLRPIKDVTLMDEAACQNTVRSVRQLLSVLPPNACMSFFVDVDKSDDSIADALQERATDKNEPAPSSESDLKRPVASRDAVADLLKARAATLRQARARKTTYYLALSLHPTDFLRLPLLSKTIFRATGSAETHGRYEEEASKLENLDGLVIGQMGAVASVERLSKDEAIAFYWRYLNPSKGWAGIAPPALRSYLTLRSQLAGSAAKDESDHFWVDGMFHQGVSLYTFGEHVELGGVDRLISKLPFGSRLAIHFMGVDLEAALDRAKNMARRSEGLAFLQGRKNYEAQAKAAELDELVTLVRSTGERLFVASLSLILKDRKADRLHRNGMQTLSLFRESIGAEGLKEDLEHKRMFLAGLPLGGVLPPRRHTLTGEACALLSPLSSPWEGCRGQGILFRTRDGGTLSLDPFDGDTPRHGIVIGSTGSGKSFTMNYLTSSLYAIDPRTQFTIVDVGGSYKRLCEVLEGSYYEIKLSKEFALNPFPPRQAMIDSKGQLDSDLTGYLSLLIEKMLEGRTGQVRRRIIERAIHNLYEAATATQAPLLGQFVKALQEFNGDEADREEAGRMARDLRLFTEGSYAAIFNTPGGLNPFSGRMTVIDLAKLKEHKLLQGILITVIGFGLARQMAERDRRKVIILDEGWEFFDDDNASELISRLYRTARKFNGAIVSVSQSPKDFLKSKASTAMLANSYWKAVLRLDMGHEDLGGFGLNSRQIETVKTLTMKKRSYSEIFLVFGENSRVVRVEPTSLEYWMSTTNAQECGLETGLIAKYPRKTRLEIIKELAKQHSVQEA